MSTLRQLLGTFVYKLRGSRPWTTGYYMHKYQSIERGIRRKVMDMERLPARYGFRVDERVVEYPWLFSRLPAGEGTLLDAGSTLNFDYLLRLPVLKQKKIFVSTLVPERNCFAALGVSYVYEDLRCSAFRDHYFDWIVCISTLEHVGMDNTLVYGARSQFMESRVDDYLQVIHEFRRLLKPSGILYLTVPYGRYAHRRWLQVFDKGMVESIVREFEPTDLSVSYFRYLPDGWVRSTQEECANETLFDIHTTPTYEPDLAASARAVVCLELIRGPLKHGHGRRVVEYELKHT